MAVAPRFFRQGTPVSTAARLPAETPVPVTPNGATAVQVPTARAVQEPSPQPLTAGSTASDDGSRRRQPLAAAPLRQFVPVQAQIAGSKIQDSRLPPPPPQAVIPAPAVSQLPDGLVQRVTAPAPPPAALPRSPSPAPVSTVVPVLPRGGQVQEPQLIERALPAYPALARRLKFTGSVRLEALVDEHGNVKDVRVLSGQPMLATAAKDAVLKWKYKPATLNGRAIASSVAIQIMFRDGN